MPDDPIPYAAGTPGDYSRAQRRIATRREPESWRDWRSWWNSLEPADQADFKREAIRQMTENIPDPKYRSRRIAELEAKDPATNKAMLAAVANVINPVPPVLKTHTQAANGGVR